MPPSFGQPEAVPASTGPTLELLNMWAAEAEPRMGGLLMKALAAAAPLTGLQHLKRVRKEGGKLQLLLCRADWRQSIPDGQQQRGGQEQEQQANGGAAGEAGSPSSSMLTGGGTGSSSDGQAPDLPPAVADVVQQHNLKPFVAQAPLHAPITREQLVEWGKHWPMTWRCPDASALPHLMELSDAEVACMQGHMEAAWQLAAANAAAGGVANACLVVDPHRDVVIAQATDCSHAHPLQHAAMAAVAAASEWQLRVWPPEQAAGPSGSEVAAEGAAAADGAEPLHAAAAAAGAAAAAPAHAGLIHAASGQLDAADGKRRRLEGSADVRGAAGTAGAGATGGQVGVAAQPGVASPASCTAVGAAPSGAADAAPAAAAAAAAAEGDPGPRPYLCTGYDAYLLHEPCVMCAMALVHSRLRRVIYCVPDARYGALGGALKLHSQRSLNHHYAVWRVPLAGGSA